MYRPAHQMLWRQHRRALPGALTALPLQQHLPRLPSKLLPLRGPSSVQGQPCWYHHHISEDLHGLTLMLWEHHYEWVSSSEVLTAHA